MIGLPLFIPSPIHVELRAALITAATDSRLEAHALPHVIGYGSQRVKSNGCGWRFIFWWDDRWWDSKPKLDGCYLAIGPDGQRWEYGADRWPSWDAGPDAVPLQPLRHLLNGEEFEQLRARLLGCACWPENVLAILKPAALTEIWTEEELLVMGGG